RRAMRSAAGGHRRSCQKLKCSSQLQECREKMLGWYGTTTVRLAALPNANGVSVQSPGSRSAPWVSDGKRNKAGKAVAGVASHRLPVVAMGSIPHIYRREGLSPGDPN
ncbi:MAG TPA: hypothetical protein VKP65_01500, partial [Rhodothermales bacterium]|nr:hypothetical protein [Rhodothermales bacterium]